MNFKEVVQVIDLQDDNIDLIQDSESMAEFCDGQYKNDEYSFGFVVWDKARAGTVIAVYGSNSVNLEAYAYKLESY